VQISVVIPARDEGDSIGPLIGEVRALEPVLDVSDHLEIIIVDDGSSDNTYGATLKSRFANRVRNALLHDGVPDTGCGLKLFPRETFPALPWFNHMHRFIPALVCSQGGDHRHGFAGDGFN
jgi:hypothetical protein